MMRLALLASLALAGCAPAPDPCLDLAPPAGTVEAGRLMAHVRVLAADSLEGREAGTRGGARARAYVREQFEAAGLAPYDGAFEHPFAMDDGDTAVNVVGVVPGVAPCVVVSAHYDHVGVEGGRVFNGADDNASGVAALIEIGRALAAEPPARCVVLAAFDAEERGLQGAEAFVADSAGWRAVVNMDMIGRSDGGVLWAAGAHHTPALAPALDAVADGAAVCVRQGHDGRDLADDWTTSSDHGPFHERGIPFVYFGVDDHADYHQPTDDVERLDPAFLAGAAEAVLATVRALGARPD